MKKTILGVTAAAALAVTGVTTVPRDCPVTKVRVTTGNTAIVEHWQPAPRPLVKACSAGGQRLLPTGPK